MFSTYETFKLPVQIDATTTTWTAVELAVGTPFFVVSTADKHGAGARHFLLHGTDELLAFAESASLGPLCSLHVMLPPSWSPTRDWASLPMREVFLQERPPDGSLPSAVARSRDGVLYGGYPVQALDGEPGPLVQLALVGNPS